MSSEIGQPYPFPPPPPPLSWASDYPPALSSNTFFPFPNAFPQPWAEKLDLGVSLRLWCLGQPWDLGWIGRPWQSEDLGSDLSSGPCAVGLEAQNFSLLWVLGLGPLPAYPL